MVQNRSESRTGIVCSRWCFGSCSRLTSCSSCFCGWVFAFGRFDHRRGITNGSQCRRIRRQKPKIPGKFHGKSTWWIRETSLIRRLSLAKIIQAGSKDRLYYLLSFVCTVSYKGVNYIWLILLSFMKSGWSKSGSKKVLFFAYNFTSAKRFCFGKCCFWFQWFWMFTIFSFHLFLKFFFPRHIEIFIQNVSQ